MQEYIIYAIFIFFPIGILMDFLLRRQGMIPKYRLVIITASLAIIISFPILMGNLGLPVALILYVSAISALTWFFIKATQSHAWYLNHGISANDEVYVSDRFIDMTKVQTVGDVEDVIWPKESESLGIDAAIDLSRSDAGIHENSVGETDILLDHDSIDESVDKLIDNEFLSREINFIEDVKPSDMQHNIDEDMYNSVNLAGEQAEHPSVLADQKEEPADEEHIIMEAAHINDEFEVSGSDGGDEAIKTIEVDGDSRPVLPIENLEISTKSSSFETEMETEINDEFVLVPEKEIAAVLESEIIFDNLSVEPEYETRAGAEDDDPLLPPIDPVETASLNEIVDVDSEQVVGNDHQVEFHVEEIIKENLDNTDGTNLSREDDEINKLIDQAFELKNEQRFMEALNFFAQALDISTNEDLRYLLLMEMVNIYKEMGMYARAEELLFLSIGKAHRRTDIIDEIQRQLSYIRLLSVELDRLGLANTPISEVPRLVRMNVAEIVKL